MVQRACPWSGARLEWTLAPAGMNENHAYIFDVEQPTQWVFDGKPTWIAGWFLSKTEAVFSDIRAVIGGRAYLGVFGLPHEHMEKCHRGRCGLPHAGFILQVCPPLGSTELRLELLDAGRNWVEIWRTPIEVRQGPATPPPLDVECLPAIWRELLQARRADPTTDLAPAADRLIEAAAAVPLDTLPNPPFFGALENPLRVAGTQFGKIRIEGWLIHKDQRIVRLLGSTHPNVENTIQHEFRERPEAGELFPDHPYARKSQFFGMLDLEEGAPNPVCVKIFAELADGSRHLVWVRRVYQKTCAQQERPLPEFSERLLLDTGRALLAAARRRGVPLGPLKPLWAAAKITRETFRRDAPLALAARALPSGDPYTAWQQANRLAPRLLAKMRESAAALQATGPRFLLLIDAAGCRGEELQQLVASLSAQLYPHWEARLVISAAPQPELANALRAEPRCTSVVHAGGADCLRALNAAAHASTASYLSLLPGHSRLSPDALLHAAEAIARRPDLELVYTDEDRMDTAGRRTAPAFKPDWSPALALSGLFPGQLSLVRRERFVALGSFRVEYPDIPWFDLLLRLGDRLPAGSVAHLPFVCHHSRANRPDTTDLAAPAVEQARQALAEAMQRRQLAASPFLPEAAHQRRLNFHQLRWDPLLLAASPVTIVIPTRDKLHLLQECIELLEETVDWRHVKLVIVDDHSRDADATRYLAQIVQRTDLRCTVVRPADPHAPFNYSHLVNLALPHIDTPLVLHLNNDVNALERGWLEEMVGWFTQPDVGVVGAKLLYPEKTLNHTGIVIGPHEGLADTPLVKAVEREAPVIWHAAAREVSAVTGACLMTRTELYRQLGGFDERDFSVSYNDVDYCLRAVAAGWRVVYTPQAKLMHWGSATRGVTFDEAEHIAFVRRHRQERDPYFSRHLMLDAQLRPRCRGAASAHTGRAGRLHVLLITHNLNLEGAPLFLLEYATHLVRSAGFEITVVSNEEGPLRTRYEELGAKIILVDRHPIYSAQNEAQFHERIAAVRATLPFDRIDLVVCNTLVGFWGVHLAKQAGKPSLFYIHESTSVYRFYERMLLRPMHRVAEQALAQADRTLFLCEATRAYYEDCNRHGNFRIVRSWIDLEGIERFKAAHTRADLRRKYGFRDDETIIANIGTVCERKGQHIFIRAIEHFNRHHRDDARPVRFVMVGARAGIYLDWLTADIERLGLTNLTLIPETREAYDFFLLADLFVCTSYEESFPRVVMEAMAFRTPIVTTDVHGIPEMVRQRAEAYLVKPGEVEGLSRMMRTCLAKERSGKSLTPTAYSKVLRAYDHREVLPQHVALAREVVLGHE